MSEMSAVVHASPVGAIFPLIESVDSVFLLPEDKWRSFRRTTPLSSSDLPSTYIAVKHSSKVNT